MNYDKTFNLFKHACEENNIDVIGVGLEFDKVYKREYKLLYEFLNTTLGSGHLNKEDIRLLQMNLLIIWRNKNNDILFLDIVNFLIVAHMCIHFAPNIRWQHITFLIFNIIFYAYWDVRILLFTFGIVAGCFYSTVLYKKSNNKLYIYAAVVGCLVTLAVFKYANFFIE